MKTKKYVIELYGDDEWLEDDWWFDTKAEQLEKYYSLIVNGKKRKNIVKRTSFYYN